MNILIVSDSFIVKEFLEELFSKLFVYPKIKTISRIYDIDNEELANQNFIFIIINKNEENVVKKLGYIKGRNKDLRILVLDILKCKKSFKQAVQMDIDGYITRTTDKEEFIYIINRIMDGKKAYDPILLKSIVSKNYSNERESLTRREKDILNELGKGLTNKEISKNLYITEYTVKKHVSNILSKLKLKNRQEVILYIKENQ